MKEFIKTNQTGLIITGIVGLIGSFIIYARNNPGMDFNFSEYVFYTIPFAFLIYSFLVFSFALFLNWVEKDK
jgi:hypothetical protein